MINIFKRKKKISAPVEVKEKIYKAYVILKRKDAEKRDIILTSDILCNYTITFKTLKELSELISDILKDSGYSRDEVQVSISVNDDNIKIVEEYCKTKKRINLLLYCIVGVMS